MEYLHCGVKPFLIGFDKIFGAGDEQEKTFIAEPIEIAQTVVEGVPIAAEMGREAERLGEAIEQTFFVARAAEAKSNHLEADGLAGGDQFIRGD